ncbi:hypothetical protein [Longispora albida]|uniref:hypothetical protein n=1 Tax=Longispora albida TaxID=203523 RepID=UPI00036CA3EA|nr:hypothetical protein [Longispora albida]
MTSATFHDLLVPLTESDVTPPRGIGVATIGPRWSAGDEGRRVLGKASNGMPVLWEPATTGQLAAAGLGAARRPGVTGVVLAPGGAGRARQRLALCAAVILPPRLGRGARVISPEPVEVPAGVSCVAHLVTQLRGTAETDTAIWEIIPSASLALACGGTLPDPALRRFLSGMVAQLAGLRTAARTGNLPATAEGQALAGFLDGRPLSMELASEVPDLICALLAGASEQDQTGGQKAA